MQTYDTEQRFLNIQVVGRTIVVGNGFVGATEIDHVLYLSSKKVNCLSIAAVITKDAITRLNTRKWFRIDLLSSNSTFGISDHHIEAITNLRCSTLSIHRPNLSTDGWCRLGLFRCSHLSLVEANLPPNTVGIWKTSAPVWKSLTLCNITMGNRDRADLFSTSWTSSVDGVPLKTIIPTLHASIMARTHFSDTAEIDYISTMTKEAQQCFQTSINEMKQFDASCQNVQVPISIKITMSTLPAYNKVRMLLLHREAIEQLGSISMQSSERAKVKQQIRLIESIPLESKPITFDLEWLRAHKMDNSVYGQESAKHKLKLIMAQVLTAYNKGATSQITPMLIEGPPGVGKTMLCKHVGDMFGFPLVTIPLASAKDPQMITGHMSTYVGARPGIVTQQYILSGSRRVVFHLDEIEKASMAVQESLIHLLDHTTNSRWKDAFFPELPIDLSECIFICTTNDVNKIHPILRNRLQARVKMQRYSATEKDTILRKFIWPKITTPLGILNTLTSCASKAIADLSDECGMRSIEEKVLTVVQTIIYEGHVGEVDSEMVGRLLSSPMDPNRPNVSMYS